MTDTSPILTEAEQGQSNMGTPKENDLRVWWVPQMPMDAFEIPVPSAEVGAILLNVLAEYDAFQYLKNIKPDYANTGGLQVFEGGEWVDWEDPETLLDDPRDAFPQPDLGWCWKLT